MKDLVQIAIQRRAGTTELEGSAFDLVELNEARELGMQHFSTHTSVFAAIRLVATKFDNLSERLKFAIAEKPESDRLLLACGFRVDDIAIPRLRPVRRHQKLPNAISISRKTPRLWSEIAHATEAKSRWVPLEMKSLARWIAIER